MTVSLSLRSERDHIELLVSHYERYFAADEYITGSIHISAYDSSSVTGFRLHRFSSVNTFVYERGINVEEAILEWM